MPVPLSYSVSRPVLEFSAPFMVTNPRVQNQKGEMVSEKLGGRPAAQRRRLSDITNTTHFSGWKNGLDDNLSELQKGNAVHLQKEIGNLKKMLDKKEAIVEAQRRDLEKLWLSYCGKSKQNEEIIHLNGQLYKDLMQARDKLKILQHENSQMTVMHKISKTELELKLKEALEQLNSLRENKGLCQNKDLVPNLLTKLAESRARRIQSANENTCESTLTAGESSCEDSTGNRIGSRRRLTTSSKEPSLKVKLRNEVPATAPTKQFGSDGLDKVSEEQEISIPTTNSTITSISNSDIDLSSTFSADSVQPPELDTVTLEATSTLKGRQSQCRPAPNTAESVHFSRRISNGRPIRKVAESIGSYKELPLNTKMRRSE